MKGKKLKVWQIILISIIVLGIIGAFTNGDESGLSKNDNKRNETESDEVIQEVEKEDETIRYEATLSNGHYVAGIDYPAGKYDITAISGNGNVSSSNMYSGGLNAIMGVSSDDMYEKEYKNINLTSGVTLSISGVTIKIISENATSKPLKGRKQSITEEYTFGSGNYTAGTDFEEGIYDISVVSGNGNVSSSNMFDGGLNAIMGINNVDMYEKEYKNVSLTKDVVLTISGVKIKLMPSK